MRSARNERWPLADTRIIMHPLNGPDQGIDVTDSLVNAIADAIDQQCEGNHVLNRLEAERLLGEFQRLMCVALHSEEVAA